MVKLLFFDLDDCLVEASTPLQQMVNENTTFKNVRLTELEYLKSMSKYALDFNACEIESAMAKGEKPKLIGSIKAGSNDIFKTVSKTSKLDELGEKKDRLKRWYQNPLELSYNIYQKTSMALEMFKEERDHFLEKDNKKSFDEGLIAYQNIFRAKNMIPGAKKLVNDILNENIYDVYVLSHHNGGREEIVKTNFINKEFPGVPFLGLRFHLEKYKKGVRRLRSSKAVYVMEMFGLDSLDDVECVLVDDSLDNLDEWEKWGGIPILYRPLNKDEIYAKELSFHGRDYPRITKMDKTLFDDAVNEYRKNKVKRI